MNHTRKQLIAAKAKNEWLRLQKELLEEKDTPQKVDLKKVKNDPN